MQERLLTENETISQTEANATGILSGHQSWYYVFLTAVCLLGLNVLTLTAVQLPWPDSKRTLLSSTSEANTTVYDDETSGAKPSPFDESEFQGKKRAANKPVHLKPILAAVEPPAAVYEMPVRTVPAADFHNMPVRTEPAVATRIRMSDYRNSSNLDMPRQTDPGMRRSTTAPKNAQPMQPVVLNLDPTPR